MTTSEASTRRRVKLYMLNDERQWDDKGTGHVSALYTEQNTIALVVISENDGSCLLESKIQPETAYQKQQETLIVWSEGENMDLALSFQEKAGCDDIWEKICNVQGKDPSVEITQDVVDESDDTDDVEAYTITSSQSLQAFELPPCELARLEEIAELTSAHPNPLQKRERLVTALERNNYIRQLIDLFHKAEDLEDMTSLHHLYEIFRQLILFNKQILYETLFSDDVIMDVIGILEYSPAGRTRHRDFLRNQANFKEVLPLHNSELVNKIHQTYRVQYIQDCCLPPPSLLDDHTMSALKSFISLNKMEIISALQEDDECMLRLFTCLKSPETSDSHRRELALFVKEFCSLSVQTDQKENFLNTLSTHGALSTVETLLTYNDHDVKSAALEVLQAFVENQPSVIREHVCKDGAKMNRDENILINLMITQLLEDPDPELGDAYQLGYMLRILIDPENMNNAAGRSEKTEFLSFFYKRCIGTLTKPLFENTIHEVPLNDNYHCALLLSNVLELLIFCIGSHTYHMKNYCLHRDLVKRVLVLLRSTHKFLVLSALRLLRKVVEMKEEFYNRYLIKNNLFKPVIDLFVANGHRYNMIDSAIIELFEYLHMEDITSLINHVVKEYWDVLCDISYVNTFKKLKERYDAPNRPSRTDGSGIFGQQAPSTIPPSRGSVASRFGRGTTDFDDEDHWFNQEDDEDEEDDVSTTHPQPHNPSISIENIPPLIFPSSTISNSPPSPSNDSPKGLHHSPSSTTTPPYALLIPPSSSPEIESPISRHPTLSSHPLISIHIKSTCLGATGSEVSDADEKVLSPPRQATKRYGINSEDGGCNDDAETSPTRHSKRPLLDEHVDNFGGAESAVRSTFQEANQKAEVSEISDSTSGGGIVGLVDYSDEESDEDELVSESSPLPEETKTALSSVSLAKNAEDEAQHIASPGSP